MVKVNTPGVAVNVTVARSLVANAVARRIKVSKVQYRINRIISASDTCPIRNRRAGFKTLRMGTSRS
ncbi:hypothetical protein G418_13014 [Rhodococcus qingshengii BKS 20-40]|nr:hypothetical protein G418_13014 [Rhodococcus qingshengii BKS 20-40]